MHDDLELLEITAVSREIDVDRLFLPVFGKREQILLGSRRRKHVPLLQEIV